MSVFDDDDFGLTVLGWLLALLGAAFTLAIAVAVIDWVQERRAFTASVSCESRQMQPRRAALSARVVCVPTASRRDTIAVQPVKP